MASLTVATCRPSDDRHARGIHATERSLTMAGITQRLGLTKPTLLLTLLLMTLAPLANLAYIPVLYDVYLIFGSVAAMLAVLTLSVPAAVAVAMAGSLVTLSLWGHPYAFVIFSLEALVVGLLHRRYRYNLVVADMVYWLLCGIPLVVIFYYFVMDNGWSTTVLIALKQPLNGVINALLASLIVLGALGLMRKPSLFRSSRFGFAEVLFIALLLGIALAGTLPIAFEGVRAQKVQEQFVAERLKEQAHFLADWLEQDTGRVAPPLNYYLERTQTRPDMGIAVLDHIGQTVSRLGPLISLDRAHGELIKRSDDLSLWLPLDEAHDLKRWQSGAYRTTVELHNLPGLAAVVLELPARPVVERLRVNQLTLLAILFAIVMLGTLAARLLSHWLTRPLSQLTQASRALTERVTEGQTATMPRSILREYDGLAKSLTTVSHALSESFGNLNRSRASLAQQVEEQTSQITYTNTLLNSVLKAATEVSIIATDSQGIITIFNQGAERLLGYPAEEMVGKRTPVLLHDPGELAQRSQQLSEALGHPVAGFQTFITKAGQGEAEISDCTYIHQDGHPVPVSLIVTAITGRDGGISGYVCIAIDISERRRIDNLKDEFIATVSHELRTPLTSIAGSLALMASGKVGEVPESMNKMLSIAESNSKRLTHLVNDLLDFQKIVSGRLDFTLKRHSLPGLVREAIDQNQPYAGDRKVSLVADEPVPDVDIKVDRGRLMQAMSNLLSNAIKFSPDGGVVRIRVMASAAAATLSVIDQGPGIPAQFRRKIFAKFAQADASDTRQQGGTGLGLAITRELVEHMGGYVHFDSAPGQETAFHITLPLADHVEGFDAQALSPPVPKDTVPTPLDQMLTEETPQKPRVLHVDDDEDLINVIRATAKDRFEIVQATSVAAARKCLTEGQFQLVVLDLGLPDGNGWQLLPDIYRQQPQAHVVILSGEAISHRELDLVEAAFTKAQVSIDVLLSALETRLHRSGNN
ncbi:ATP-binding protein [Marinobacter sp. SS21]|uniref:ATP-binding protein n=1 Tax=Marinobacter sp. SS21 TaxID=2979460 RepID=UPI00232F90F0|nr:ATP-binding protein [Marinobacter sp. SS21]MDC0661268.1 ATP-binding protein [Marinobacter sp. SS21]